MQNKRYNHDKKTLLKRCLIGCAALVAAMGAMTAALRAADSKKTVTATETTATDTITYNGVTYAPKGNLETYLLAGIDSPGKVEPIESYDGTGQCDTLMVVVRDRSTETCKVLTIDRNTMCDVKSLEDDGTYIDTSRVQISLAHAMSLDHQTRADNTVDAVSNLLGGHQIDGYAMVNMGAIQTVNDMVGGVTVTVEDDFPGSDTLIKGETVTLMGTDAETFVHDRKTVGDGLNDNRMHRQQVYEEAFMKAFRSKCSEDQTFPLDVYEAISDYMTTNISAKKFTRLALLFSDDSKEEKLTIEGQEGFDEDGWQTFTPDQDSLEKVILELFYKEV